MDKSLYGTGTGMVDRIGPLSVLIIVVILALCTLLTGAGGSGFPVCAEGDLDGDNSTEDYLLEEKRLTVNEGNQCLWQSPKDWCVDNFALEDADNDGTPNLVISLWKTGSFASSQPFWHQGEDVSYKNHLFVFKLVDSTFKEVWCSSDLDRPIVSFTIKDMNGDGLNELVVEEGKYRKVLGERYALDTGTSVRTTVWEWQEWGFRAITGE